MTDKLFTKNFLLLILGQLASLFGNFILKLALSMYVLEITGSAAVFAGILSMSAIPAILLSPVGGILADRVNRRNLMVALDGLTGISVLCAAVALSGSNALAVIGALLVILSVLGAFETPVVQACIPAMLQGDDIMKVNGIVNQAASLSYLTAPMLGGVCYGLFGLKPVMYASVGCFFLTALFECFIQLPLQSAPAPSGKGFLSTASQDFLESMRYLFREQVDVFRLLLLTGCSRFFVMGILVVGLPFLVRNLLGLSSAYYGAAESALAVATILGSGAAGILGERLNMQRLSLLLASMGLFLIPPGLGFLCPLTAVAAYCLIVVSLCGMQIAISMFSVAAVSLIQQRTPGHLIGKVMACTSAVTLCVQPVGQMAYGYLFERFCGSVFLVFLATGLALWAVGGTAKRMFAGNGRGEL